MKRFAFGLLLCALPVLGQNTTSGVADSKRGCTTPTANNPHPSNACNVDRTQPGTPTPNTSNSSRTETTVIPDSDDPNVAKDRVITTTTTSDGTVYVNSSAHLNIGSHSTTVVPPKTVPPKRTIQKAPDVSKADTKRQQKTPLKEQASTREEPISSHSEPSQPFGTTGTMDYTLNYSTDSSTVSHLSVTPQEVQLRERYRGEYGANDTLVVFKPSTVTELGEIKEKVVVGRTYFYFRVSANIDHSSYSMWKGEVPAKNSGKVDAYTIEFASLAEAQQARQLLGGK